MARPRLRRGAKIAALVLGGAVLLVALLLGAILIALQTDWGRDRVRRELVTRIDQAVEGQVEVGRLRGNILGSFVLEDVVIRAPSGEVVARLPRVILDYSPLSLLDRTFHADALRLESPELIARQGADGELDLLRALSPVAEDEETTDRPWSVAIHDLAMAGGSFTLHRADGSELAFRDLALGASLSVVGERIGVELEQAQARWVERDLVITARGSLDKQGDLLALDEALVAIGESRFGIPAALVNLDTGTGRARYDLAIDRALIAALLPEQDVRGDFALSGDLVRETAELPWYLEGQGSLAGAPVEVQANVDPDAVEIELGARAQRFNPQAVVPSAPPGRLDLSVRAEMKGPGFSELTGRGAAELSGQLRGATIRRGRADLRIEESQVIFQSSAPPAAPLPMQPRTQAPQRRTIELGPELDPDDPAETGTRLEAELDLAQLVPTVPLQGPLDLDARISGPLGALEVSGTFTAPRLRWNDVVVEQARGRVDMSGVPAKPRGELTLRADRARRGDDSFGPIRIAADVAEGGNRVDASFELGERGTTYASSGRLELRRAKGRTRIGFPALALRTRGLTWDGGGTTIAYGDERVELEELVLRSAAGRVEISGTIRPGERLGGALDLNLADLDLDRLRRALAPDARPLFGTASVRGDVRLPAGPVELTARFEELRLDRARDGYDGQAAIAIRDRLLDTSLSFRGPDARGDVKAQVRAPSYLLDVDRWTELEADRVRSIEADIGELQAERLAALAGIDAIEGGEVSIEARAGEGLSPASVTVTARDLRTPLRDRITAQATAELDQAGLQVAAMVDARRQGAIELRASATVPDQVLEVEAWRRQGLQALERAELTARDLDLGRLRRLVDGAPAIGGKLDLEMVATERADDIELRTAFTGLELPGLRQRLSGWIGAELAPDQTEVRLTTQLPGDVVATANLDVGAGGRLLFRAPDLDALRRASIQGTITAPGLPLDMIAGQFGISQRVEGTLVASAEVSGTFASPVVEAAARAPGARVGTLRFDRLIASGRYQAGRWRAAVDAAQRGGGSLTATSEGSLDPDQPLALELAARNFRLGFLTTLLQPTRQPVRQVGGLLDANLEVVGPRMNPELQGWLRVTKGRLALQERFRPFTNVTLQASAYQNLAGFRLEGQSGRGRVEATGTADLEGLIPVAFDGKMSVDELPFTAGTMPVAITAATVVEGDRAREDLWQMTARVENAMIRLPEQAGRGQLHEVGDLEDVVYVEDLDGEEVDRQRPTVIRIRVSTPKGVIVRSEEVNALARADLEVTFINGGMSIQGDASVESGRIELFDRRYDVVYARAAFEGRMPPNPRIDARLAHDFDQALVYIDVSGTLEAPELEFISDPPVYDRAQVLSIILGGNPDAAGAGGGLGDRAEGVLAGVISGQIEGVLRRNFPIDFLRIGTEEAQPSFVTVGKWLSDDLFVAYQRRFDPREDENANEARLEYYLSRRWMLEGSFGDRGVGSADILWTRRF